MKKILIIMLCILVFIVICLFLLSNFKFNISIAGSNKELRSVRESKEFGVFVSEYYNPESFAMFPDNNRLFIKESWIEHSWAYNSWSKADTNCRDCREIHGLYLVFNENLNKYFQDRIIFQWKNGESGFAKENETEDKTWNQVSMWSSEYRYEDTLNVYATKYHSETQKYDTVSSFILVKKK